MTKDDGGQAFPTGEPFWVLGMTLRDWFAGQALAGIANEQMLATTMTERECELRFINAAAMCGRLADAMIAERKK